MASSVASSSLKSGTFAPATTSRERFTPFLPLSVDWGLRGPPKTRLAHRPIGGLPLKVHPAEFLALLDEPLPDEIQHAKLDPPLQGAMHRRVVGQLLWQTVPLATTSHPEDDRIEGFTPVYAWTAGAFWRVVFFEDRLDDLPQLVRHSPDGGKRLHLGRSFCHQQDLFQ